MGIFTDYDNDINFLKSKIEFFETKIDVLTTNISDITKQIRRLKDQNKQLLLFYYKDIYGYQKAKGEHYVITLDTPDEEIELINTLLVCKFKFVCGIEKTSNFPHTDKFLVLTLIPEGALYTVSILCNKKVLCLSEVIEACEKYEKDHKQKGKK